jgi:hypothetical protein
MTDKRIRPRLPYEEPKEGVGFPLLTEDGDFYELVGFDEPNGSLMGSYWNTVRKAMEDPEQYEDQLAAFEGVTVRDLLKNPYKLQTDIDALVQFHAEMSEEERESFERTFYHPRVQVSQ